MPKADRQIRRKTRQEERHPQTSRVSKSNENSSALDSDTLNSTLSSKGNDFSQSTFEQHADLLSDGRLSQPMYLQQRIDIMRNLQSNYGNLYVQRLIEHVRGRRAQGIQTQLTVGPAGDKYEQEADDVAKEVMNMATSTEETAAQRQGEEEEEDTAQRTAPISAEGGDVDTDVEHDIRNASGKGQPLPDDLRSSMEGAFGSDFGGVRVHSDAESDTLNQSMSARAFTTGNDIFFAQGQYNPGNSAGQEVLAHELTHVVQQTGVGRLSQEEPLSEDISRLAQRAFEDESGLIDLDANLKGEVGIQGIVKSGTSLYPTSVLQNSKQAPLLKFDASKKCFFHDIGEKKWLYIQVPEQSMNSTGKAEDFEFDKKAAKREGPATVGLVSKGRVNSLGLQKEHKAVEGDLFPHDPVVPDIKQAALGDCYLLASLAAVTRSDPNFIKGMMSDPGNGTVYVRFYRVTSSGNGAKSFSPEYVSVKKSLVMTKGGDQAFQQGPSIWPGLLVKAYTAWNGRDEASLPGFSGVYQGISGGHESTAWEHLLGRPGAQEGIQKSAIVEDNVLPGDPKFKFIEPWDRSITVGHQFFVPPKTKQEAIEEVAKRVLTPGQNLNDIKKALEATTNSLNGKIPGEILLQRLIPKMSLDDIQKWMAYAKANDVNKKAAEYRKLGTKDAKKPTDFDFFYKVLAEAGLSPPGQVEMVEYCAHFLDGSPASPAYSDIAIDLYDKFTDVLGSGGYVGLGTGDWGKGTGISGGEATDVVVGMAGTHAYEVVKVEQDPDGRRYVTVRNPWGSFGREYDIDFKGKEISSGEYRVELSDVRRYFENVYYSPPKAPVTITPDDMQKKADSISKEIMALLDTDPTASMEWVQDKLREYRGQLMQMQFQITSTPGPDFSMVSLDISILMDSIIKLVPH